MGSYFSKEKLDLYSLNTKNHHPSTIAMTQMIWFLTLYLSKAVVHYRRSPVNMNNVLGALLQLNGQGQLLRILLALDGTFFCYVSPLRWYYIGWVKSGHGKGQDVYGNEHIHPDGSQTYTVKHAVKPANRQRDAARCMLLFRGKPITSSPQEFHSFALYELWSQRKTCSFA